MSSTMENNHAVLDFKKFLNSRETGLKQGSLDWVNARLSTVGGSEISALTGSSPFETPTSLLAEKLQLGDTFTKNVSCTWGSIFEPLAREFFKRKHSVSIFGYDSYLRLPRDNPLYGKLTFSPDGYFLDHQKGTLKLVEFKCPCTRRIVRNAVPPHYIDQIQTGLHLIKMSKAIFACFRM